MQQQNEYIFTAITVKNWEAVLEKELRPITKNLADNMKELNESAARTKLVIFTAYRLKQIRDLHNRLLFGCALIERVVREFELLSSTQEDPNIETVYCYLDVICRAMDSILIDVVTLNRKLPRLNEFLNITRQELFYFEKMRQEQSGTAPVYVPNLSKVYLKIPKMLHGSPDSAQFQQEMYDMVCQLKAIKKEDIFIDKNAVREYIRENIGGKDFLLFEFNIPESYERLSRQWQHNINNPVSLQTLMRQMQSLMQIENFAGCWYANKSGAHATALQFFPMKQIYLIDKIDVGNNEALSRYYSSL